MNQKSKKESGQVALFVALAFQILFVFFAMIINIGLLVHHKINLQNSVDLAAYYGASKQAEMMNAVSHVNFQIRQAYKLLMFRYHSLGTAGDVTSRAPYLSNQIPKNINPRYSSNEVPQNNSDQLRPVFCITYDPVSVVEPNETYCKDLNRGDIPLPGDPKLTVVSSFFFLDLAYKMAALSKALKTKAQNSCKYIAVLNWLQLANFLVGYKNDIAKRKEVLIGLANNLSESRPKDINGDSIYEGVYRTFENNLTYQNRDSMRTSYSESGEGTGSSTNAEFKFFNSLSSESCGSTGTQHEPPKWLKEILIFSLYSYMDAACGADDSTQNLAFRPSYINDSIGLETKPDPNYVQEFNNKIGQNILTPQLVDQLRQLLRSEAQLRPQDRLFSSSLGFEKNPWCQSYVGVSASASPRIPFAPGGFIKLEASSYAKPFGSQIGPWFGRSWPSSAEQSSTDPVEARGPYRVPAGSIDSVTQALRNAELNYQDKFKTFSRFLGDPFGFRSPLTLAQFSRAIHSNQRIDLTWWSETSGTASEISTDKLSWNFDDPSKNWMRELEIAAITPNQFEVSQYAIDPNFYDNYLTKLEKGFGSSLPIKYIADYGQRINVDDKLKKFSVRDQIETTFRTNKIINPPDVQNTLTYTISSPHALLTSWQSKNFETYSVVDESRFGRCLSPIPATDPPDKQTAGSCAVGGRVGYSVKLVSKDLLNSSELESGGPGQTGSIKNPPPF